jgi:hypothetical protein
MLSSIDQVREGLDTIYLDRERQASCYLNASIALNNLVPRFAHSVGMFFAKPDSEIYLKSVQEEWEAIRKVVCVGMNHE